MGKKKHNVHRPNGKMYAATDISTSSESKSYISCRSEGLQKNAVFSFLLHITSDLKRQNRIILYKLAVTVQVYSLQVLIINWQHLITWGDVN